MGQNLSTIDIIKKKSKNKNILSKEEIGIYLFIYSINKK